MTKQGVHPSGRVVSVRLDEETIERLDNLSERTGRSRGFYLKLAIRAMLPSLEQKHWEHAAAQFEEDVIDRRFREIMTQALDTDNDQE
ncbi:MAG: ribbon-helix-helix domain-containing protein [Enterobacterales bacterium]|nr:ribbon-helix-helix domain-containing protein [Enterobacterales bacterium]